MKILAVDDEPLFLEVLDVALQDLGYGDVTQIYSAKEALRELEEGSAPFSCILLDIRMPGMNGVDLCRAIRNIPGYKRTPIMMITALADREFIDAAFAAGASDYLMKPLDMLELRARMSMIERLIDEQSRNVLLEQRSNLTYLSEDIDTEVGDLEFDFETALPLVEFDRIIEFPAMENYLQSLSTKDSYATAVFALRIQNAAIIYERAKRVDFVNMLCDVGITLETVLKSSKALISYAGKGVFVAAARDPVQFDKDVLEGQLQKRLRDFEQIYERDHLPAPLVSVGPVIRKSLFLCPRTSDILPSAISAAETGDMAATRLLLTDEVEPRMRRVGM